MKCPNCTRTLIKVTNQSGTYYFCNHCEYHSNVWPKIMFRTALIVVFVTCIAIIFGSLIGFLWTH